MDYKIYHVCHVNGDQKQVFEALTTVEKLQQWWTTDVTGDASMNGRITFGFPNMEIEMRVAAQLEGQKVVWVVERGPDDWLGSEITFSLDQNDGKTRIRFTHDNWEKQDEFYAQCSFSWAKYMMSIRDLIETGAGKPYDKNRPMD